MERWKIVALIAILFSFISAVSFLIKKQIAKDNYEAINSIQKIKIPEGSWTVATTEYNNETSIIRYREDIDGYISRFPIRLGISYNFDDSLASEIHYQVEDALLDEYDNTGSGILVEIFSWQDIKVKEFMLYSNSDNDIDRVVSKLKTSFPNLEITSYIEEDTKWNEYFKWIK